MAYAKVNSCTAADGTANWGGYYFLTKTRIHRIRQNGTITRIKFYASGSVTTAMKLMIWRKVGANSYDLVGESEDFKASVIDGLNTIDLASPISNVQEGDYVGYYQMGGTVLYAPSTTDTGTYYQDGPPSASGEAWESHSVLQVVLPIECYMDPPALVGIGDSLMAGHNQHWSYKEGNESNTDAPTKSAIHKLGDLRTEVFQNTGVGSETTLDVANRIYDDRTDLLPTRAVVLAGVNDLSNGDTQAQYIARMTTILDALDAAGIVPVLVHILPWTNGTNTQMQTRDAWKAALVTLAAGYSGAVLVDADSAVGQFRSGGDAGNLWDIKTAYNDDNVHLNEDGYTALAQAIFDALTGGWLRYRHI